MKRILTSELPAHPGERVLLRGWLHRTRRLSGTQRDLKKGGAADEAPPRPWRMQG